MSDTTEFFNPREPGNCLPWDPNFDCCDDWASYQADLQLRATSLAWSALRSLTAGLVGSCPVALRPCLTAAPCVQCFGLQWTPPPPEQIDCRRAGVCSCSTMCVIVLPGQAAALTAVVLDGVSLDLGLFRIDNFREVVRQDGLCFPACQDMSAPAGEPGTLVVEYVPGVMPTAAGLWAAGILACEFAKACNGGKCRLPRGVTAVARQGVSMEFPRSMWENGVGIQEVDAYIHSLNPNKLTSPPMVWSPDMRSAKHRFTTWVAPPVEVEP